jgi:DNA helicase-4
MTFPVGDINARSEQDLVRLMTGLLPDLPLNSSVLFIGRYNFDIGMIKNSSDFSFKFDNNAQRINIIFKRREDLKITFLTVHRSKGLQADYVFILNNQRTSLGFPSKIQDAPIMNMLLDNSDEYPHSEERRLFYVAMTRAKKKIFLLTVKDGESEFVKELRLTHREEMKREREANTCPSCGGRLVKRKGPHSEFFGCSNYSTNGCKYTRQIQNT